MIKTFKVKHGGKLSNDLDKAMKVAVFAVHNRDKLSSKHVKHIGLKSAISNQILRKYGKNRKCQYIKSVNLIVPGQSLKVKSNLLEITPLKLIVDIAYLPSYTKVNQVELDSTYAYISVTISESTKYNSIGSLGIDRNTTGHCVVAADNVSNIVLMLGKQSQYIHKKYSNIRKRLQSLGKFKKLKTIKHRESSKVRDLNHKMSRKLVDYAYDNRLDIKLEDLTGIRKTAKTRKSFKYSLNSWSFYQLQQFIEYKAMELGVSVIYVAPQYTSKSCSKCGHIGERNDKTFKCHTCGHVSHADINASYNIANLSMGDCIKKKIGTKGALMPLKGTNQVA